MSPIFHAWMLLLIGIGFMIWANSDPRKPDWLRIGMMIASAFCLYGASRAYRLRYPKNPKFREIVKLSERRRFSGQGSLSAMSAIGNYLANDPDPAVRKFAAETLAQRPGFFVPGHLRVACIKDSDEDVRLTCLSLLVKALDPEVLKTQGWNSTDMGRVRDETIDGLKSLVENINESIHIRDKANAVISDLQSLRL